MILSKSSYKFFFCLDLPKKANSNFPSPGKIPIYVYYIAKGLNSPAYRYKAVRRDTPS